MARDPTGASDRVAAGKPPRASVAEIIRTRLLEAGNRRFGLHRPQLPTISAVSSIANAIRYVPDARNWFIEQVQMAMLNEEEAARRWWLVFGDLSPTQQAAANFDDVCAAAQVRPSELLAMVTFYTLEAQRDMGNVLAGLAHPSIVRQTIKSARRIAGKHAHIALRDREMLHQHRGFVPIPRTAVVNVNASATATAASQARADQAAAASAPGMPSFAEEMRQVGAGRTARAQLAAADRSRDPIEGAAVRQATPVPAARE